MMGETLRALVIGGKTGWVGQKVVELLQKNSEWEAVKASSTRMEEREALAREMDEFQPTRVFVAAGLTGRPNVDWCEDHKVEVLRANVIGTLNVFDLCHIRGTHCTYFGTGCIYEYDGDKHTPEKPVTEEDPPNFQGSYYAKTKAMVDQLTLDYENVLNLRLRMPISDDLHARSLLTKLLKYEKLVNIPNSMSILSDLLPLSLEMSKKKSTGTFNFTNRGVISHNELLGMYKEHVDPSIGWENFSVEEQAKILKAGRSNTSLSVDKLEIEVGRQIPHIKDSMVKVMQKLASQNH